MSNLKLWAILAFVAVFSSGAVVGLLGKDVSASSSSPRSARMLDVIRPNDSRLVEELGLSTDQAEQLRRIWSDAIADAGPPPFEQVESIQQRREEAVRAMLTEPQRAEYDRINADFDSQMQAAHAKTQSSFRAAEERTRAILDERQRAKYDELLKRGPAGERGNVFRLKVSGPAEALP